MLWCWWNLNQIVWSESFEVLTPFWKTYLWLKQYFDAKLLTNEGRCSPTHVTSLKCSSSAEKGLSFIQKGLSFINENQSLYCEYMFLVRNFKNINWEHVEFDEESPRFYSF